ncbi:hypothetical protein [Limobrevibacterium gyesilva]|uniref:Uncharacterized protein n=1 Tax=Limobrevibacterium gyesilva TaxID=2991712 RepID=A0AA41YL36_9PROT|nr:hypothetical protein [Limobrevibacterium gyesilva]MCW3475844.1 hypothetical protein [Limobrevibacterium gyesilva]
MAAGLRLAGVITLVSDLDTSQTGLITVSQQPLYDVIEGLPAAP